MKKQFNSFKRKKKSELNSFIREKDKWNIIKYKSNLVFSIFDMLIIYLF